MRCTQASCRAVIAVPGGVPEAVAAGVPAPVFDWRTAPPPAPGEPAPPPKPASKLPPPTLPQPAWLPEPAPPRSFRKWIVAGLALFVGAAALSGLAVLIRTYTQAEERLSAQAQKAFSDGEFGKAADLYGGLVNDFPRSARAAEFRFRSDLSKARRLAGLVPPAPTDALAALESFVAAQASNPLLSQHRVDVFTAATKTAGDFVAEGLDRLPADVAGADTRLTDARRTLALAEKYSPADADTAATRQRIDTLAAGINRERNRATARAEIVRLLGLARPDLDAARELMRRAGFIDDAELRTAWTAAEGRLRGLVEYKTDPKKPLPGGPITTKGLLPAPAATAAGPRTPVLARGLLAALDSRTGRVAWADRVGIDAVGPVIPLSADRWLIVSDPPALELRDVSTGHKVWTLPLDAPALGPPVLMNGRAYLALGGPVGTVWEVDATTGERVGLFTTGGPLAAGVAVHPSKARLFVPAAAQQTYVLDFAPEDGGSPRCISTVATGHSAGSLRRPPQAFALPDGGLALEVETTGDLGSTLLELLRLPENPAATAVLLDRVRVPGTSTFGTARQNDRLAVAGDRGAISVWGLRLPGASDPPLYPVLEEPAGSGPVLASFLLWHRDSIIALTDGRLRQWRPVVDRAKGPRLSTGWSLTEPLGSAACPPTVADGVITAVTFRTETNQTLVTSVVADTGEVLWQRTLGFAADDFAAIDGRIVLVDPRGVVTAIEGDVAANSGWQFVGRELAGSVSGLVRPATVSPGAVVAPTTDGVLLRRLAPDGNVNDQRITLSSPLAGRAAVLPDAAVLPLANGRLVRVARSGSALTQGPTWRPSGANPENPGSVIPWQGDTFLVHDGSRRITLLRWGDAGDYDLRTPTAHERPRRLVAPPCVLPGPTPRAAIADASGMVVILRGDRLDVQRSWKLGEEPAITAGPVALGDLVGVVRGRRELVALHPDRPEPAWRFTLPDAELVGSPQLAGSAIALADSLGRLWLLDPATGKARRHELPAPLVAAAGPVPLSTDRLLVFLVDGSACIVPVADFAAK
jgi:outer membrane protein assembly factor BamB